ncbi:RNA polymerase sigma factor [Sphingobacteriaceae bacterium WQ 2009]|uniref:RNA polymerase sigma factor n=1 Tax=Rhinopithecimicrobium faecis TaxID=2820698 RepID=A0A8T4H9F6_9SPHI|nr:RNA polymerase sigma factor [Sphingobacteriaceae bacterium WQ 2009]
MGIINTYFNKSKALTLVEALRECALKNSERSKSFLYKKYYGYIMAITLRYVKNEYDAEELTNESFIRVFKNFHNFNYQIEEERLDKSFRAWIARIAVNISIDFLRAKKTMESLDAINELDSISPLVASNQTLEVEDIYKLLFELPDIQRSIFNLFEIEGYSHEEIGSMLNIPDSTSRTYLTRAKQKLRKLYESSQLTYNNSNHE